MSEQKQYNHDDVIMAKFALALGLPVRIFIIRTIINQNNLARKEDFDNALFKAELINKHISQLKGLGILKIKTEKRKNTYSIDKPFFSSMSGKFDLLFKSLEHKNEPATPLIESGHPPNLKFKAYVKTQRLNFHLSQEEFALRLKMDKDSIAKIERGEILFPPEKLYELSQVIYDDPVLIRKIYYDDPSVCYIAQDSIGEDNF